MTGQAWQTLLQATRELGFYSTVQTTAPAGALWRPEMKAALQSGHTTRDAHNVRSLAVPVKVRGEVIGVIDFSKPGEDTVWTSEEVALLESLTEQLGVALESARLYQDTQRRAAQEQLVGQVTRRMRESLDIEQVLQTATEQVFQALGLDEVVIQLVTEEDVAQN